MKQMLIALTLVIVFCSAGMAAVTPCATGQNLAFYATTYATLGNACQLDDKIFWGFVDTVSAGGGASAAGVGITVTPDNTHFNPGLSFTLSGFSVGANQSLDLKLGFRVAVLNGGNLMDDFSLGIAGAQNSGTGLVSIGENVCVAGNFSNLGAGTGCSSGSAPPNEISLNVQNPGPPPKFFDIQFVTPISFADVFKDVSVTGGSAGSASLSSFSQNFSEVPETSSILLLGTTMLMTSLAFRRKRAKS